MPRRVPRRKKGPRDIDPKDCLISEPLELPPRFHQRRLISKKIVNSRDPAFDWMVEKGVRRAVEVGSQWGWWAHRAAKQIPELKLWCVDPWWEDGASAIEWSGDRNIYEWQLNIGQWLGDRVFGLRGTSLEVVDFFEDGYLDAVFIDGDHSTKGVALDLKLWVPKVRQGGLIMGHDWDGLWGKHVRPAVCEYFEGLGSIAADVGYLSKAKASVVWRVEKTWP